MSTRPRFEPPPGPDPEAELRKAEMAIRQLERAELYIVAAINCDLAEPTLRHELRLLHGQLLEVHERLRGPRVAP